MNLITLSTELKGIRVLVVDDQVGIQQLLCEILQGEAYDVRLASNGFEALDAIKCFNPNIVLIDMKMPEMNGLEVIRETKLRGNFNGRFIMMTAYGELEIIDEATKLGVGFYVGKPFEIDELLLLIKQACDSMEDEQPNCS